MRQAASVISCLKDGFLVAGMNVNTRNAAVIIGALVEAWRTIKAAALADPAADQAGLVPAAA